MHSRVDSWVLWLRALAVGGLAFMLGVVGHVSADGLLPGPALLLVLLVFGVVMSAPLLNGPASTARLVLMLVGGQTLIHVALTATAGHVGDSAATSPTPSSPAMAPTAPVLPTDADGRRVGSLQDAYSQMLPAPGDHQPTLPIGHLISDMSAHAPMMAAHLAAAVLVGLYLGYGERSLWALIRWAGQALLVLIRIPAAMPLSVARLLSTVDRTPPAPRRRWGVQPLSRRGPPPVLA